MIVVDTPVTVVGIDTGGMLRLVEVLIDMDGAVTVTVVVVVEIPGIVVGIEPGTVIVTVLVVGMDGIDVGKGVHVGPPTVETVTEVVHVSPAATGAGLAAARYTARAARDKKRAIRVTMFVLCDEVYEGSEARCRLWQKLGQGSRPLYHRHRTCYINPRKRSYGRLT